MYLYALFVSSPLELLSQPLYICYHHGDVSLFVVVDSELELCLLECSSSVELASLPLLCLCSNWCCSLFMVNMGKRQDCNALLK